jgi:hypothetical protein
MEHVGGIRNKVLSVLVHRSQSPYGVFSHIRMSVIEASLGGGKEGFDQFGFSKFGEEPESVAADKLVGML